MSEILKPEEIKRRLDVEYLNASTLEVYNLVSESDETAPSNDEFGVLMAAISCTLDLLTAWQQRLDTLESHIRHLQSFHRDEVLERLGAQAGAISNLEYNLRTLTQNVTIDDRCNRTTASSLRIAEENIEDFGARLTALEAAADLPKELRVRIYALKARIKALETKAKPEVRVEAPRGLYGKYVIYKAGTGEEVQDVCFVLKLTDPHAIVALEAYANSCERENAELAQDIRQMIEMAQS